MCIRTAGTARILGYRGGEGEVGDAAGAAYGFDTEALDSR